MEPSFVQISDNDKIFEIEGSFVGRNPFSLSGRENFVRLVSQTACGGRQAGNVRNFQIARQNVPKIVRDSAIVVANHRSLKSGQKETVQEPTNRRSIRLENKN